MQGKMLSLMEKETKVSMPGTINGIKIKRLSIEDFNIKLKEIMEVYHNAYIEMPIYAYQKRHDIKGYLKWLYKVDPEGFFVATLNNKIVGFIAVCQNWWDYGLNEYIGEIHEWVVERDYQKCGIGSLLFKTATNVLKKRHNAIGLWVGNKNEKAISFYKKKGFQISGKMGKWLRMRKIF